MYNYNNITNTEEEKEKIFNGIEIITNNINTLKKELKKTNDINIYYFYNRQLQEQKQQLKNLRRILKNFFN